MPCAARTCLEDRIGSHQNADQRQQEDGVRGTTGESHGREEKPANDGNSHAEKDHCRCIIPHGVVNPIGFGGEAVGDAQTEKGEGVRCQNQKAGKYEDVNDTGERISWMPPLREPELQNFRQALQWPVKTEVALRTQKRCDTPGCNVGKAREPQEVEEEEQLPPADEPESGSRDRVTTFYHAYIPRSKAGRREGVPGDSPGDYIVAIILSTDKRSFRINRRRMRRSFRVRRLLYT